MRVTRGFLLGAALIAIVAAGAVRGQSFDLGLEDRTNEYPAVVAMGDFVAVAWGATTKGGVTDVYVAVSRDGGRAFGAPVRVNHVDGQARLSGQQPPQIALVPGAGRHPSIAVVWTAKSTTGTMLLSARSADGGRTFGRAAPVPGSSAGGNRGWQSVAVGPDGQVSVLWLDHREVPASAGAHGEHHHPTESRKETPTDGVARAQLSKLFFARLGQPGSVKTIAGGVCYCCATSMAASAGGALYAAWRHVYAGNIRDIAFTMSRDGGRTFSAPLRVSEDGWAIDGCPENGPALAIDGNGHIHAVWPTLIPASRSGADGTPALFHAMSTDGTRFTPRLRVPTEGVPRHPRMAFGSAGLILAWDEVSEGTHRIAMAHARIPRGAPAGRITLTRLPPAADATGDYPAVVATNSGAVVAWASRGRVKTRRVVQ